MGIIWLGYLSCFALTLLNAILLSRFNLTIHDVTTTYNHVLYTNIITSIKPDSSTEQCKNLLLSTTQTNKIEPSQGRSRKL